MHVLHRSQAAEDLHVILGANECLWIARFIDARISRFLDHDVLSRGRLRAISTDGLSSRPSYDVNIWSSLRMVVSSSYMRRTGLTYPC